MEQGTPIELAAGQEARNINVALPRGGDLTGLLFDPFGDPVTGATVRALRFRYTSGTWRLSPVGRGNQTDDRGAYRIYTGRVLRRRHVAAFGWPRTPERARCRADVLPGD